jgi:hypothetical protein
MVTNPRTNRRVGGGRVAHCGRSVSRFNSYGTSGYLSRRIRLAVRIKACRVSGSRRARWPSTRRSSVKCGVSCSCSRIASQSPNTRPLARTVSRPMSLTATPPGPPLGRPALVRRWSEFTTQGRAARFAIGRKILPKFSKSARRKSAENTRHLSPPHRRIAKSETSWIPKESEARIICAAQLVYISTLIRPVPNLGRDFPRFFGLFRLELRM